jgi:hypothetical protein
LTVFRNFREKPKSLANVIEVLFEGVHFDDSAPIEAEFDGFVMDNSGKSHPALSWGKRMAL